MLNYWTKPYPDEILYSIIARHISYFGNKGPKQLLPLLFGRSTVSSTIDLPSGLASLAKKTSQHKLGSMDLIHNHTLFPYYSKFMSDEKNEKVISSMLNSSGDIHTRWGINAGQFPSFRMPRYCPECHYEDHGVFSETYFRRAHQIPSLKICTTHNLFLKEVEPNAESINKHFFVKPQFISEDRSFIRSNSNKSILDVGNKIVSILSKESDYFFDGNPYYYNQLIKQLGFRKGGSSLQITNIYECFQKFYDDETLSHYESSVDVENENCWLKAILRKHRKGFDPVRHILIQDFINGLKLKRSAKHFFERTKRYDCRNPICKEYKTDKNTSFKVRIDPKSKRKIIYIKCDCGYSYTKSFIKAKNSWFIRVKDFGPLWERELMKLIKSGKSIRSIAASLQADSKTIKQKLNRVTKQNSPSTIINKKKEWAQLMKKFPFHSVTDLRRVNPALYSLLYRHTKNWLLDQNYASKIRIPIKRINWGERDSQLLNEVRIAFDQLKTEYPKRRRSTTTLLNLMGKDSMFRKNKAKLPKLTKFLHAKSESLHQFRLRRLAMVAIEMRERKEPMTYWKLLRAANIRKEYVNESIHNIVLKILNGNIYDPLEISQIA